MLATETDLPDLLRTADHLMRKARLERKAGHLDAAEAALLEAAGLLSRELHEREKHLGSSQVSLPASTDRRELAIRLADCYGPLGGIARRKGKDGLTTAFAWYDKGRKLELNADYGIASTYNRLQWIVVQILMNPKSIAASDGILMDEARALVRLLTHGSTKAADRAESGIRAVNLSAKDPWTIADALLLSAILNDRRGVREAWDALENARPIRDVYESGLPVLRGLAIALPQNELLRDAVEKYQSQLEPESSVRR